MVSPDGMGLGPGGVYPGNRGGWPAAAGKVLLFFCPSMRAEEIIDLREHYPDLFRRALALEDNARANLKTVQGLGRNYSWRERFGKEFI